ncbi:TetR/AcrR family transcriptional regulator [Pseudomonas sp. 17391]|jgi:TetR/AcrR family transcriptional repressor of nem operon|uniref:TetR/AcrR family transcriptional regulator n=1 Tax=unclassified Pseudomonas TaxID=196821 RepID=UPI000513B8A6|nr:MULTISPECIES: TetR/AcrR family transcriptional regulator [unclassified Pseudomonas]KGI94495.1 TetR family transcriptional regulator [Pseudomonas sp. H2]MDD2129949.1 TetR/AcrR family transcriptional regulator [Pseudomonas sp. 17391]
MARPQEFDTQQVLRKAMAVFWEKGFEATSLADLMAATALSKSSLYGSFGDKRELFLAAFDAYRKDRKRDMIHLLSAEPAREGIVSFFESLFANLDSETAHNGCMSVNQAVEMAPRDLRVRDMVAEDFQTIHEALKVAIQRGQGDGSVTNSSDAEDIASILVLAFPGLQLMARIGVGNEAMSKTLALLMRQLD